MRDCQDRGEMIFLDGSVGFIFVNDLKEMRPLFDILCKAMEIECPARRLYEETRIGSDTARKMGREDEMVLTSLRGGLQALGNGSWNDI